MIVRRLMFVAAALLAALCGTGCGDRGAGALAAETDDPYYVQGIQLIRQGRNPEALTSFLKVIDRRGEKGAAESHLQAGQIYLHHIKEPAFAYYHFRKYLELQPNSSQSELVRGQVAAALREFAKTVPGRALDDQSVRLKADAEISKLQHEVDELRAELAVLRGSATMPVTRPARMISVPAVSAANASPAPKPPVATETQSPITAAPAVTPPVTVAPQRSSAASPVMTAPITSATVPAKTAGSSRSPTSSRPTPTTSGRTHTVAAKETLFSISKRYGVTIEDLVAANGLGSVKTPLRIGAVLKIPAAR